MGENPVPGYALIIQPAKRGEAGTDGPAATTIMVWEEDGQVTKKSVTVEEWVEP